MGIDFTVLLDHSLSWEELLALPGALDAEWRKPDSPLRALQQPGRPEEETWRWALQPAFSSAGEELFENGYVDLDAPAGISGIVFRRGVRIYHVTRWWSFLQEPAVQAQLRAAVARIGEVLRARTAIYLPDSMYTCALASERLEDGQGIEDALTWLRSHCGPPAQAIADIYQEDGNTWSGDGYFVEPL